MEPKGRVNKSNGPKKKAFDPLEYLKFALSNCRKNRLKDEYLARSTSEVTKFKAVNTKGSIFYYSVTNSTNSEDSDSDGSDSEESDEEEDDVTDHLSNAEFKLSLNKPENFQDFVSDFHANDALISGAENPNDNDQETNNLESLFNFEDVQINELWIDDFQDTAQQNQGSTQQQQELLDFAEQMMSDMKKEQNNTLITSSAATAETIDEFTQNLGSLPDGDDFYQYAEICDSAAFFSTTVDEFISEFSAMTLNQ